MRIARGRGACASANIACANHVAPAVMEGRFCLLKARREWA